MNKPLDILQIAPRLPWPASDGGRQGIYNITKSMAKRGHRITFVCPGSGGENLSVMHEICTPHVVRHNTENSTSGALMNLFSSLPYTVAKMQSAPLREKLRRLCRESRFDVVHVDHIHMAPYGAMLKKEFGLPYVIREHNFETNIYRRFGEQQRRLPFRIYMGMQTRRLFRFESAQLRQADICAAITGQEAGQIREVSDVRVEVIPAGVDLDEHRLLDRSLEEPAHLCILGSMDWKPGVDAVRWFLQDILPLLKKELPEIRITVAGDAPPNWLTRYGDPCVEAPGFVTDLRELLERCTLPVVPLRIGGGMRLKLLEYFALGKAVVSTHIGAEGNTARHGEQILLADTAGDFAASVLTLLRDRQLRRRLGDSARSLVENNYSWDIIGERFERAYIAAMSLRRDT